MNVTPRQRTRVEPTRWKLTCGICLHVFEAQAEYTPRIAAPCPSCGTGNVWSEPGAVPTEAPAAASAPVSTPGEAPPAAT
ncbi:MAG: hypothetical protein IPK07_27605 [Deltaproteobacteria bacterium]|nr:hypothetical protein [Deltaproteobacteria bacterium]